MSPYNTSDVLTANQYNHWDLGEPNGDIQENCAVVRRKLATNGYYSGWNDKSCTALRCSVCDIDSVPSFQMRGNKIQSNLLLCSLTTKTLS